MAIHQCCQTIYQFLVGASISLPCVFPVITFVQRSLLCKIRTFFRHLFWYWVKFLIPWVCFFLVHLRNRMSFASSCADPTIYLPQPPPSSLLRLPVILAALILLLSFTPCAFVYTGIQVTLEQDEIQKSISHSGFIRNWLDKSSEVLTALMWGIVEDYRCYYFHLFSFYNEMAMSLCNGLFWYVLAMWHMNYKRSAEHRASKIISPHLKVSAGVLCPAWGTMLQEMCGPVGNGPGKSDERAQKHNLWGKAEKTEVV